MFAIYDNDRPAKYPECKVDRKAWPNNKFKSFAEAREYVSRWLGSDSFYPIPQQWDGSKYDYSGYGDTIEIRKE